MSVGIVSWVDVRVLGIINRFLWINACDHGCMGDPFRVGRLANPLASGSNLITIPKKPCVRMRGLNRRNISWRMHGSVVDLLNVSGALNANSRKEDFLQR